VLAALVAMRATLPRRIGGLLDRAGATVATLHHLVATRAVIERCHAHGAAVWVWTVDEPRTVTRLAAAGVDGIVSNDPRVLAATLTA
jgi:glycerophosphoryl diester phosphodiesterase